MILLKYRLLMLTVAFFLMLTVLAETVAPIKIPCSKDRPVIDGALSGKVWEEAAGIDEFHLLKADGNRRLVICRFPVSQRGCAYNFFEYSVKIILIQKATLL